LSVQEGQRYPNFSGRKKDGSGEAVFTPSNIYQKGTQSIARKIRIFAFALKRYNNMWRL